MIVFFRLSRLRTNGRNLGRSLAWHKRPKILATRTSMRCRSNSPGTGPFLLLVAFNSSRTFAKRFWSFLVPSCFHNCEMVDFIKRYLLLSVICCAGWTAQAFLATTLPNYGNRVHDSTQRCIKRDRARSSTELFGSGKAFRSATRLPLYAIRTGGRVARYKQFALHQSTRPAWKNPLWLGMALVAIIAAWAGLGGIASNSSHILSYSRSMVEMRTYNNYGNLITHREEWVSFNSNILDLK